MKNRLCILILVIVCLAANRESHGFQPRSRRRIRFIGHERLSLAAVSTSNERQDESSLDKFSKDVGEAALKQVEKLGRLVSDDGDSSEPTKSPNGGLSGMGNSVFEGSSLSQIAGTVEEENSNSRVWLALARLEQDMQALDMMAGRRSQLTALEVSLLSGAVLSAAGGPLLFGGHITEFLAPSAAAFTAAIGIGAEYTGKVAVADGKEVAASALQCAAEAEGFLAQSERAKAIIPLCVGIGATTASFALLVPVLLDTLNVSYNLQIITEIYLFCPLVAVLSAAVASLAFQETRSLASRAIGVGTRRFARSGTVGRTWLSTSELIDRSSSNVTNKWKTFSLSVLPAPLLGSLVPGALPTKTIVIAALAAAQSAYFLTLSESVLSRASDAVALKARSAAVCDTYANQGARSAAILPFTSALSSLCAAATAALVELPFLESLAAVQNVPNLAGQVILVSIFPTLAALFSGAASVSKARCKVDAEAAKQAACTLALQYGEDEEDPVLRPFQGVVELVRLTISANFKDPLKRFFRRLGLVKAFRWIRGKGNSPDSAPNPA